MSDAPVRLPAVEPAGFASAVVPEVDQLESALDGTVAAPRAGVCQVNWTLMPFYPGLNPGRASVPSEAITPPVEARADLTAPERCRDR